MSSETGMYQCPRCGGIVCNRIQAALPPASPTVEADGVVSEPASQPTSARSYDLPDPPTLDTWELDEHLRRAARLLGLHPSDNAGRPPTRFDPAQPAAAGWHQSERRRAWSWRQSGLSVPHRLVGLLGAVLTWLGTTALTCGGTLMGWANLAARQELQTVGWPIAVGGAIALVVGVAIYLDQSRLAARSAASSATRRIDLDSARPGRGPHPRRPAGQRAGKAA